ncbi:MAG: hypothetical protein WBF34_06040 [Streptosporangiaceae bacterium]
MKLRKSNVSGLPRSCLPPPGGVPPELDQPFALVQVQAELREPLDAGLLTTAAPARSAITTPDGPALVRRQSRHLIRDRYASLRTVAGCRGQAVVVAAGAVLGGDVPGGFSRRPVHDRGVDGSGDHSH